MSEQEFNKIFANNLSRLIDASGHTQAELAKFVGVSTASVSNWRKGIKLPRMDKVDRMCDFFHVRRSDLMEDKTDVIYPAAAPCSPASGYGKLLDNLHINNSSMLEIVKICSNLNQEGVEKVLGYAQDLEASGLYNICNSDELLEKKAN